MGRADRTTTNETAQNCKKGNFVCYIILHYVFMKHILTKYLVIVLYRGSQTHELAALLSESYESEPE